MTSLFRLLWCGCLGLIAPAAFAASTEAAGLAASKVEQLLATANIGKPPVLWFGADPLRNLGSGHSAWSAQSGGAFTLRDADAWGRPASAFGLASDAKGGVAITGSTTQNPIHAGAGTVIVFFRPGPNSNPPFLVFSRADWGKPQFLSLRVNAVEGRMELTLAVADSTNHSRATQANLATVKRGSWAFAALTWEQIDGQCHFHSWAGDLIAGELTEYTLVVPPLDPSPAMFLLGGRRADEVAKLGSSLIFSDGLFCHFAVYDRALGAETIQDIYLAASPH